MINLQNTSIIGVGIDQGIANCGYSVVKLNEKEEIKVLKFGTIETDSETPLPQRLMLLYEKIWSLLEAYPVSIIGCEYLFFNPVYSSEQKKKRNKSASIVYTNMATGIIYFIAGQKRIPIRQFVPGTVKKYLAGHGRAKKEEVKQAVLDVIGEETFLKTSHEADAIAIGITAVKYYKDFYEKIKKQKKRKE